MNNGPYSQVGKEIERAAAERAAKRIPVKRSIECLPLDILYILGAHRNGTGLSPRQARELTASILQELIIVLYREFGSGPSACYMAEVLIERLELHRKVLDMPIQRWETWDDETGESGKVGP